jgi:DNA-binding NarL/FixJ family response regulator
MSPTLSHAKRSLPTAIGPWLPPRIRVLYIATANRTGGWLAEAFAADSASEVVLEEAIGSVAGLARLRDELFDAVLVSHQPGELDALELIDGYRTGVADAPIIVLGTESEQEMAAACYELGADAYVCVNTTTTRNLIWVVARAVQRHELVRENHCLTQARQRQLRQEHDEANRLLAQQQGLIDALEALECRGGVSEPLAIPDEVPSGNSAASRCRAPDLPAELIAHYHELLRTYVIMGSGNLARELSRLADLLTTAGVSARETMQLHLCVLEELVQGLGVRSTRHVMTRADLLVLEIMIHLAEGYRSRYQERVDPGAQGTLPGFEQPVPDAF